MGVACNLPFHQVYAACICFNFRMLSTLPWTQEEAITWIIDFSSFLNFLSSEYSRSVCPFDFQNTKFQVNPFPINTLSVKSIFDRNSQGLRLTQVHIRPINHQEHRGYQHKWLWWRMCTLLTMQLNRAANCQGQRQHGLCYRKWGCCCMRKKA